MLHSQLLSSVPGVFHAFTTRDGGVSTGAYASLNLGHTQGTGDDVENLARNAEILRSELGAQKLVKTNQVHGHRVVDALEAGPHVDADGMHTTQRGVGLMVRVADCAPVLLARRDGTAVAAVHAGWRGAVARIASRAVALLGTTDVVAAVGPCIGPCCFEVGPEVVTAASALAGSGVVTMGPRGKPHVDLWAVVMADLAQAGVRPGRVEAMRFCTVCDARFFSHRRDAGVTGRQCGVVGLRS